MIDDAYQFADAVTLRKAPGYWYIATPFSNYPRGREQAYHDAREVDAMLDWARVKRFTPIVHTWEIAQYAQLDTMDHDFWMRVDQPFMERAHGLVIVTMDGWGKSEGMRMEYDFFAGKDRPILKLDPNTFDYLH